MGATLRENMREVARSMIDSIVTVRYVDAAWITGEGIGLYLIDKYTNSVKYRPNSEHWSDYLKHKHVLESTLLWIHNIKPELIGSLAEDCHRLGSICPFVLETDSESIRFPGIKRLDARNYFTEYDFLSLASRIAAERAALSDSWRRYLADLALELYPGDAERIVDFAEHFDVRRPPTDYDAAITNKPVWKAQLLNVFHAIEEERNALISRYEKDIASCLPEIQFSYEIYDPYDCELGLLCSLTSARRLDDGKKRLIMQQNDYGYLFFLHHARNQLAHNKCLAPEEMERILGRRE